MEPQNYKNHVHYYTAHHFIFYPVVLIFAGVCLYFSSKYEEQSLIWIALSGILMIMAWLSFILRQHYALMNQDRIVRVEMRLRYYILTNERFEKLEAQLSKGQVLALRFASDEELVALIKRAIKENLSPNEIKKSIINWVPDYNRV